MLGIWLLMALVIALDQFTKALIRGHMNVADTIPVIRDVFHITYVQNRGAAFSMFQNMPVMTILFPSAAMIVCLILIFRFQKNRERFISVALALVVAGGVGNLIDRLLIGFVTDMFDFRVFPVFNVADISVCVGCGLIVLWMLFIDGKRTEEGTGRPSLPENHK